MVAIACVVPSFGASSSLLRVRRRWLPLDTTAGLVSVTARAWGLSVPAQLKRVAAPLKTLIAGKLLPPLRRRRFATPARSLVAPRDSVDVWENEGGKFPG
jgi:hypothetical protein